MIDFIKARKDFEKKNEIPPYEVWMPEFFNDPEAIAFKCDFEQTVRNFMKLVYEKFLEEKDEEINS